MNSELLFFFSLFAFVVSTFGKAQVSQVDFKYILKSYQTQIKSKHISKIQIGIGENERKIDVVDYFKTPREILILPPQLTS